MLKAIRQGISLLALLGLLLGAAPAIHGAEAPNNTPIERVASKTIPVSAALISEDSSVLPGQPFWVAIPLHLDKHWHAYWKNPGDSGMAPVVTWTLPEGFKAGEIQWAAPKRFTLDQHVGFGYEDELVLLVQITPPSTYTEATAKLAAKVRWVVCSDSTCLPGNSLVTMEMPVNTNPPTKIAANAAIFDSARKKIPQKHENNITARHDDALIELSFQDPVPGRQVKDIEFFPEHEGINYNLPALVETSKETPGKYILVFEELSPQEQLKGVVVLHTATGKVAYEIGVPVTSASREQPIASIASRDVAPAHQFDDPHEFKGGIGLAMALALLGGMILNLMPCVLPVISFKILSFINLAGKQRTLIFKHGMAFSSGVMISFWVLAALLLGLQAYGRSVGWGFQLQEPLFVAVLAAFIFVFGLSLFGLFEIGTSVMSKAGEVQHQASKSNAYLGSFMSGILATAVATPCTGPFLGSTVGFAVTLPAPEAMMIFTALGFGMCSPYLFLSIFPSMLRLLPKPGAWMVTFKELMGFLMMASVIWLLWVFSAQTGTFATTIFIIGLFFLAVGSWIYGRWATPASAKSTRTISTVATLAFFLLGGYTIMSSTSKWVDSMDASSSHYSAESEVADVWEEFSPKRVAELRKKGIPVFIDFTAKWCLICQANHVVLSTAEVAKKFTERGVVRMKADWTKSDEMIAEELRKFGRNSVPLYVFYDADPKAEPEILPQLLTSEIVVGAIDKVKSKL